MHRKKILKRTLIILGILILFRFFLSAWPFFILVFALLLFTKSLKAQPSEQNFRLLVAASLISISVAEIAFRIIGHHQVYQERILRPLDHIFLTSYASPFSSCDNHWLLIHSGDSFGPQKAKEYTTGGWHPNDEGLHDIQRSLKKTKKYRVIALGDSFTEGVGASSDSSFVRLLELNNDTLEVFNAGIGGSDPAFELKLLEMRLFKYHPDAAIMSINHSDINDFIMRGGLERFKPDSTIQSKKGPWWEPFYANSFLFRAFIHDICKLDWNLLSQKEEKEAQDRAFREVTLVLQICAKEYRERNIRFVANFHPMIEEVLQDSMECTPIMRTLQKQHIETFDMLNYFGSHGIDSAHVEKYYWHYDRHHNSRGYAIMAQGLDSLFR